MSESSRECSQLSFLFAKWQHHDSLMYRGLATVWAVEAVVISAAALIISAAALTSREMTPAIKIALALALFFVGWIAWRSREMTRMYRRVRNSFNPAIVAQMSSIGILKQPEAFWDAQHWSPDKDRHPMNLWHTPDPQGRGSGTRASGIVEEQIIILCVLDIVAGAALLAWAIFGG